MAAWCTIKLSYNDWTRSYKRDIRVHDHALARTFVANALADALAELRRTHGAGFVQSQIVQGPLATYMPNDPGVNYRSI